MAWPDADPPVFKSVLVAPRDPASRVEGDVLPLTRKAERGKDGHWTCAPVRVRGEFAVAVDLVDPTPVGNKLGIQRAALIGPDGSTLFEVRHDTIAYDEHGSAFAYHPACNDGGHFLLLWRWPGNAAASNAVSPGDGWCPAPAEAGDYRIELVDFMGNAATLELPVRPHAEKDSPAAPDAAPASDKADGELTLDASGTFLVVTATFPTPETRAPELTVNGKPAADAPFFPVDKRRFRAAWQSASPGGRATIGATHPRLAAEPIAVETVASGAARTIQWEDGPRLEIPAGAACGPLFLRAEALAAAAPAPSVPTHGTAWRLWPDTAPLAAAAEIALPLPDGVRDPARAAIARRGGSGWSWLKTARRGGMLAARTDRLGDFRVIEDDQPPRELEFAPGGTAPINSARPRIHASVSDAGSGIAAWSLRCDGRWLLSAYDPEAGRVDWERDEDLAAGAHEITLKLTDNAGNSSTAKHAIIIPKK
jgi:hypothetical protein